MSKKSAVQTIKIEGVSMNATYIAGQPRADWVKHGKTAGYFTTVGGKTATPEQQEATLNKAYELAHDKVGTKAEPAKVEKPAAGVTK